MATLDDKLLGEKTHYYCDSSDEETGRDGDEEKGPKVTKSSISKLTSNVEPEPGDDWKGYSTNVSIAISSVCIKINAVSFQTGPKGVINDFQRWKQLEAEKSVANDVERLALAKKLSMVCKTLEQEEEEKKANTRVDEEMDQLLENSDTFLEEYMRRRMEEMSQKKQTKRCFGKAVRLNSGAEFLNEIEKENESDVCIICHIFSFGIPECVMINKYFEQLAQFFKETKFISIEVASVGMSQHFVSSFLRIKLQLLIASFV